MARYALPARLFAWGVLVAVWGSGPPSPAAAAPPPDEAGWCLRCHGMATLSDRDPTTGEIIDLSVDREAFVHSNHGELACQDCHDDTGFQAFPHSEAARRTRLHCLDCHDPKDDPKFARYRFPEIEAEFKRSVHFREHPQAFDCFTCHDPHAFEIADKARFTAEVIAQDNGMCLQCHTAPQRLSVLAPERRFPDLDAIHSWLPKPDLHWRAVRCVECHTPATASGRMSHTVLGKDKAERNCVVCHTTDSLLLTKLYRHRKTEEVETAGFVNAVMLNDAYIIGATRNAVLDWLTYLLVGGTALGVAGHAAARVYFAGKRRQGGGR